MLQTFTQQNPVSLVQRKLVAPSPTNEAYREWLIAYDYFNQRLFFPLVLLLYTCWATDWDMHKATLSPKDDNLLRASPNPANETGFVSSPVAILPQEPWRRRGPRAARHDPDRSFRNTNDLRAGPSSEGDR